MGCLNKNCVCALVFNFLFQKSINLSLNKAIDVAQIRPLWDWLYALIVVRARNEWTNECEDAQYKDGWWLRMREEQLA